MRSSWTSGAVSLAGAVLFGALGATLWRHQAGTQFWLANTSAPYLALAFTAGWAVARQGATARVAAGLGLAATLTALASFYVLEVTHFHRAVTSAERDLTRYAAGALLSGPIFGVLGARWAHNRSCWAIAALASAFVLEPRAWDSWFGYPVMPDRIAHAELLAGLALLIGGLAARVPWSRSDA